MYKIGKPNHFTDLIINFIIFQKIYFSFNGILYGPRIAHIGLSLGSILSPILCFTFDLEDVFTNGVKIIQYADNVCIYSIGYNTNISYTDLNKAIVLVTKWMNYHLQNQKILHL